MSPPRAAPDGGAPRPTIWTIGHSTLPIAAFLERLAGPRIEALCDVRRYPASRRHPQFNGAALARSLDEAGIAYAHLEALGGRREPDGGERNAALADPAFRGYADWMGGAAFAAGLERLLAIAAHSRTAVMCAEADVARCHRRLLADTLAARGVEVLHIQDVAPPRPHALSPQARIADGRVSYPAPFF